MLLRRLFPNASYMLLEDSDVKARARSDPGALMEEPACRSFSTRFKNVPELTDVYGNVVKEILNWFPKTAIEKSKVVV
jgi:hypothetical protein